MSSTPRLNILKSIYVLIVLLNITAFMFGVSRIIVFFRDFSDPELYHATFYQLSCGVYFVLCIFLGLKFCFCTSACCCQSYQPWAITMDVILLLVIGLNFASYENFWIILLLEVLFAVDGSLMYAIKDEVSRVLGSQGTAI